MTPDPETLSRLLHDLTPQPPVTVHLADVADRMRRRRRWQTTATLATVCLLVAAAVTVPVAISRHGHPSAPATPDGGTQGRQLAPAPGCPIDKLQLTLTWVSRDRVLAGVLTATNRTGHPCALNARPALSPLDVSDRPLDTEQFEPNPAGPGPLRLSAGASAVSAISWGNWCSGPLPSQRVRVSWAGGGTTTVSATGPRPPTSCPATPQTPAGQLSSSWFRALLSPPGQAVTITSNQTFIAGKVTLQPPNGPARNFPVTPVQALALTEPSDDLGAGGSVTVEYGLYSNNDYGTYNPKTGTTTKLYMQRVPAYIVINRGPNETAPGSRTHGPGVNVSGLIAATGQTLGRTGEVGTDSDVTRPGPAGCAWNLSANGTKVTASDGPTGITLHVGDELDVSNVSGCPSPTTLGASASASAGALAATSSRSRLVATTPGTTRLSVQLIGCSSSGLRPPCFGSLAIIGDLQVTVLP